jgi:hypothetical protein
MKMPLIAVQFYGEVVPDNKSKKKKKESYTRKRPWRPIGL